MSSCHSLHRAQSSADFEHGAADKKAPIWQSQLRGSPLQRSLGQGLTDAPAGEPGVGRRSHTHTAPLSDYGEHTECPSIKHLNAYEVDSSVLTRPCCRRCAWSFCAMRPATNPRGFARWVPNRFRRWPCPTCRLRNPRDVLDAETCAPRVVGVVQQALSRPCRRGHSACYQRVPPLGEELRIRHGNGTFGKWLLQLAKTDVLLLDDWGMAGIDGQTRADLVAPAIPLQPA